MAGIPDAVRTVAIRLELDNGILVRPGDTLVVGVNRALSQHEAHVLTERLAEKLPDVPVVIIDQCTGLAVHQPDEPCARCGATGKIHNVHE